MIKQRAFHTFSTIYEFQLDIIVILIRFKIVYSTKLMAIPNEILQLTVVYFFIQMNQHKRS